MLHEDLTNAAVKTIPTYHPAAVLRQYEWRRIAVADLRRAARFRGGEEYPPADWRFLVRPSFDDATDALDHLYVRAFHSDGITLAADIETAHGHITCIGLAWSARDALCIPFTSVEKPEGYWTLEEESHLVWRLYRLLTHPQTRVIMQNGHYDCQYIAKHWGFIPNLTFDTMIAHHVCFAGLPKKLDFQASMYADYYCQWKPDRTKTAKEGE